MQRSKDVLSAANKQIKMLDQKLQAVKEKKRKLKALIQDYANISDGKNSGNPPLT